MSRIAYGIAALLVAGGAAAYARPELLPPGTSIEVRTNDPIDVRDASDGRIFTAEVARDVRDQDGSIAIPRGARAELVVRNIGEHDLGVDLESITVEGCRYMVASDTSVAAAPDRQGVGANKRTGEFVGGGGLIGTILGAIGGGGKGAAIGALAGGAAGAGAQTLTRGRNVRVPAESVLTFRLNQPLRLRSDPDGGFSRDGRHYH